MNQSQLFNTKCVADTKFSRDLFIKLGKLKGKCLLGMKLFFFYKVRPFHFYLIYNLENLLDNVTDDIV